MEVSPGYQPLAPKGVDGREGLFAQVLNKSHASSKHTFSCLNASSKAKQLVKRRNQEGLNSNKH